MTTTDRDELIRVGVKAYHNAREEWLSDEMHVAAVIDAVEPLIAKAASTAALQEATRDVQALSVKAKVGYSDATWVRLDHVTGLLRRRATAAGGQQ